MLHMTKSPSLLMDVLAEKNLVSCQLGCQISKSFDTGDTGLILVTKREGKSHAMGQIFCGCTKANNVGSEGEEDGRDKMRELSFTWLMKDVIK